MSFAFCFRDSNESNHERNPGLSKRVVYVYHTVNDSQRKAPDDMAKPTLNKTPLKDVFAQNCRELRKCRGWTQQALADKIGIARARVAEVERATKDNKLDTVSKFATAFRKQAYQMLVPRPGT